VRHFGNRKPHSRRQLSESQLAIEVERMGAVCPLSTDEITVWAQKLNGAGVDGERRLQTLVTYWFHQASSFVCVDKAHEEGRVRDFVKQRVAQGVSPDAVDLPKHLHRVDKWLPEIGERLACVYSQLLALPDDVDTALCVRFSEYDTALDYLALLPSMLNTVAETWYRPRRGQPSLEMKGAAVGLLICAVEDFTGEKFRSPRSNKRLAELEFAQLLAERLFSSSTAAKIRTILRHFHNRRADEVRGARPPRQGGQL
jgi:hypothetical protein